MARVVLPGGRVVILELTPMSKTLGSGLIQFYFHRVVPWLGHLVAGNRAAYTYLPQSVANFPDAGRLVELVPGRRVKFGGIQDYGIRRRSLTLGIQAHRLTGPGPWSSGGCRNTLGS